MSRIGPTRGRSISSRSRSESRPERLAAIEVLVLEGRQLAVVEAEPAAQPHAHPVGRRGPVERPRDRGAPVDDDRVAALSRTWRRPMWNDLDAAVLGVAVGAAEERRCVGVGGQRGEPFGAHPAEAVAGQLVDAVVGDPVGGLLHRAQAARPQGRGGLVREQYRIRAHRIFDATGRRQRVFRRSIRPSPLQDGGAKLCCVTRADDFAGSGASPRSAEHARLAESPSREQPVAAVGSVPLRTAVGHRPRGLLRGRRRLDLSAVRARPRPRVPLGRGRPRRHLRPVRLPQLLGRAVERARPDPEGAAVRPDQRRGQPRRGRQGVLVGRRRHAHPLVDAVALPLSAGRVSRTRSCATRTLDAAATSGSTSSPTPASSTTTGSSTSRSPTPRPRRTTSAS